MTFNKDVKNIIKRILLLLLLFAIIVMLNSCGTMAVSKLNGSFENTGEDDLPYGWTSNLLSQSKKFAVLEVDDDVSYDGGNSVSISISKDHPDGNSIYRWARRIEDYQVGSTYEIQGMIKTSGIKNSPFIEVECWSDKMMIGLLSSRKTYPVTGKTDWRQVNMLLKIPEKTIKILILVGLSSENNHGGKVWFDDIEFKKID